MSYLNAVDYIVIVLLLLGSIKGAIKGFLEELAQKFGLVLGLVASLMFTKSVTPFVQDKLSTPAWVSAGISYVVIFIIGYLVIKLIGSVLQTVFKASNLDFIDNFLGFILGAFELVLLIGIIQEVLQHQSLLNVNHYFQDSLLCSKFITPLFKWLYGLVQKAI